jgi:hypothetical protein
MASPKGGLYISFENARRVDLQEAAGAHDRFSVELSNSDWQLGQKEIFLISLSEERDRIDYAAIARKKRGPKNTAACNLEFSGFVEFERPLSLASLIQELPRDLATLVKDREGKRGKWFPPTVWLAVLDLLKRMSPNAAQPLDKLWSLVNANEEIDIGRNTERLGMQRDAIGLSLDVAGLPDLRRREFRRISLAQADIATSSFIELMDSQPPQERMLVDHDRRIFEEAIASGEYETREFSEGPRTLRVWTVDKEPIEQFTGVDLIILNEDYNSLLMVQYKCMRQEAGTDASQWRYRPDGSFRDELSRMEGVQRLIEESSSPVKKMEDLRLVADTLYFKFCKRLPLARQDGELAEGMLMSLAATQTFLTTSISYGPREGRFIGYENCERYLNNSIFAALARDGWIGSCGLTDEDYKAIMGLTRSGRSLVLAQTRTSNPKAERTAQRRRNAQDRPGNTYFRG